MNIEIHGGKKLHGSIETSASKNGAVGLLCAALLNKGTTTLKRVPKIEEVNRILEVLESIGFEINWVNNELTLQPPKTYNLKDINIDSAKRTRAIIMFIGPLIHQFKKFSLPQSGGCKLGKRTAKPHLYALTKLGVSIETKKDAYVVSTRTLKSTEIILYESGDTVTENAILAAALVPGKTTIKYASANYMVQELCFFLQDCGVKIEGIGTTTLVVHGRSSINKDVTYTLSEDPTDAMFFLTAGIVTKSTLTIKRCPIRFLELELLILEIMGLKYTKSKTYSSYNKRTELVDITVQPSTLTAPEEKIHARPYPGLNMDNLPFFALIATQAKGRTLIHDWTYEKRAIYYTELERIGAETDLADPHRIFIDGPTKLMSAEMMCPPALRPSAILLVGMLAAKGASKLRGIYSINRGYENIVNRLNNLGASISIIDDFTD